MKRLVLVKFQVVLFRFIRVNYEAIFYTGGLPDIVEHKRTGYLAQPFHTQDLAAGISWLLEDPQRRVGLGHAARQRAERLWAPARVAGMYAEVYGQVIERSAQKGTSTFPLR